MMTRRLLGRAQAPLTADRRDAVWQVGRGRLSRWDLRGSRCAPIRWAEPHVYAVAVAVGMVADGMSEPEITAAYPDLETEDVREAIRYAAEAVRERELPLAAFG